MPHASDPRLLVLHALRLKGFAGPEALAVAGGLQPDQVQARLEELAGDGLVQWRHGRVSGWSLTGAGRQQHSDLLAADMEASGAREEIREAYDRFQAVNADLLNACTAWQLRVSPGHSQINDHTDADYDREVLARLDDIHAVAVPVCADLGRTLQRFAPYGPRLQHAHDRVADGQLDWFTKPVMDSYHTVWFELHEDLLQSLGLDRSREQVR